MKTTKKLISTVLCMALAAGTLAGCGSTANPSSSTAAVGSEAVPAGKAADTKSLSSYDGDKNLKITDEPTTLSLFFAYRSFGAVDGDLPIYQEIEKITNVNFENIANESITEESQSLNTMLATGELPDVIHGRTSELNKLKSQGVFMPLDDLIESYAPNINAFFEAFPAAKAASKGPDGKIYTITGSMGGQAGRMLPSIGYFIRQDWLDALGLEVPTTLEEYKKVLYAFKNEDPNGNGKADEIPFFTRESNGGIYQILQLWNTTDGWLIDEETNKPIWGRASDNYKEALMELSQWYADGIIDPELFSRGSEAREALLGSNVGGSTCDWFASTGKVAEEVAKSVEGLEFKPIAPPENINGEPAMLKGRDSIHVYSWGISSKCEDPITAIKYLDFFFSETGTTLSAYGREGVDYTVVDGEKVPAEEAVAHAEGYPVYLRSIGAGWEIGNYGNLSGELISMTDVAREGFELYNSDAVIIKEQFPQLLFTDEEQKLIDTNWSNIYANIQEYEQSCLMGRLNVEETWEQHIKELDDMKYQEIQAVYDAAYTRYLAQ